MTISVNSLPAAIQQMNSDFSSAYADAFNSAKPLSESIVNQVPIKSEAFTLVGLTQFPQMRKWLGPRSIKRLSTMTFVATTDDYESTIAVRRNAVLGDNIGQYLPLVKAQGAAGAKLPDTLAAQTLKNGVSDLGFDGLAIFSTAHTLNPSGDQSNLMTGSLNAGNFQEAYQRMIQFTGDDGRPLGVEPKVLVVPPALRADAVAILKAERNNYGATNINYELTDLLVLPELGAANADGTPAESTAWYLLGEVAGFKALDYYVFRPPTFTPMIDPMSPNVFYDREYIYGMDATVRMVLPLWFCAIRSKP